MKFIVCLLLVSVYVAQAHSSFWDDDSMEDMFGSSHIRERIHKNMDRMNKKIQRNREAEVENANAMRKRIEDDAESGGTYAHSETHDSSNSEVSESRHTESGRDRNGNTYSREIVTKVINGVLYCTETVRNPTTGITTVSEYTQDLGDSNAERVLVKRTQTED